MNPFAKLLVGRVKSSSPWKCAEPDTVGKLEDAGKFATMTAEKLVWDSFNKDMLLRASAKDWESMYLTTPRGADPLVEARDYLAKKAEAERGAGRSDDFGDALAYMGARAGGKRWSMGASPLKPASFGSIITATGDDFTKTPTMTTETKTDNSASVMAACRLIREKAGVGVVDSGKEFPAHDKLARALVRLPWLWPVPDEFTEEDGQEWARVWDDQHTAALSRCFTENPHPRLYEALQAVKREAAALLADFDPVGQVEATLTPKSEHSPEAQLQIELESAELDQDDFYGSF